MLAGCESASGVTPEDKIQAPSGKAKAPSDCGRPSTIAGAQPVLANMWRRRLTKRSSRFPDYLKPGWPASAHESFPESQLQALDAGRRNRHSFWSDSFTRAIRVTGANIAPGRDSKIQIRGIRKRYPLYPKRYSGAFLATWLAMIAP